MPSLIRTKSGIYYIVESRDGKRRWWSTRTRDKLQADRLFLLSTNNIRRSAPHMLSECILEYMQYVKTNFAPRTQSTYQSALANLLKSVGDIEISRISALAIERYKNARALNVKGVSVNIELRTMRAFFNCLKRWEIISKNPCDNVSDIRIPDEIPAYLKSEELRRLIELITVPWLRDIVTFAAMSGARLGEITNLRWNDVNLANRTVTIVSSRMYHVKGGKCRILPMNETLLRLLEPKEPKQGYVFTGKKGGRANGNFVSENFRLEIRKHGFDRRLHFHSLRHTFASMLVTNGTSLYHVQQLLGHSSPAVTQIYSHLQHSGLQDVVESINV